MRIAIPVADGRLCMHFGHCEEFAFVDTDGPSGKITGTHLVTPPPHVPGLLPEWIKAQGADVVIAGGIGSRAVDLLAAHGIDVVTGAAVAGPEAVAQAFMDGTLVRGGNSCDH